MDDIATIVPFRLGGLTRLAEVLTDDQRESLAIAMLSDVVASVRGAGIEPIVAAADPRTGDRVAEALPDTTCVLDPPGSTLDACVATHAATHPDGLLVVMADLPALKPTDVTALTGLDAAVVLAETVDGGTGALLRRPSSVVATAYGHGSARRHEQLANEAGVACLRVQLAGLAFEIDRPEDLERARHEAIGVATSDFLGSESP